MTIISKLWQHFLDDDVESFRNVLANPTSALPKDLRPPGADASAIVGSIDINALDRYGRTLLHHIASSGKPTAGKFAQAIFTVPQLDIHIQDLESGWNALHRALYTGNASIAHMLLAKDAQQAREFKKGKGKGKASALGLISVKDHEGNTPLEVYGQTIKIRELNGDEKARRCFTWSPDRYEDVCDYGAGEQMDFDHDVVKMDHVKPTIDVEGDEVFTFGSNKNFSLGLGDHDDRQFPERASVVRPDELLHRFYREHQQRKLHQRGTAHLEEIEDATSVQDIPMVVRSRPIHYQDVVMSKLHTAILTSDSTSNLYMTGFGPGGRLGTGDQGTRFNFVCIDGGGLAGKRVVSVALGQDHSIAITDRGEIFTWGTNKYGQLGYSVPHARGAVNDNVPVQTSPRQIFNPLKKEVVLGAAASSVHSAVFTNSGLYTFGKNEGQLGFMDADARSLESQTIPRRVGASLLNSPIKMVSAIDRATTVLLENHEVWVFTHYGYAKIIYPLDGPNKIINYSNLRARYGDKLNYISKITSGGNTVCALSNFGEVYSIDLTSKITESSSPGSSTTKPTKIRNALPPPSRVWVLKKGHMAARDVAVGQDGSIILCTESGSAWRKEKRVKAKRDGASSKNHDFKFVRVPGLSRVVAVRSNAFGAYSTIQRGTDVTKKQILEPEKSLWKEMYMLLPSHVREALSSRHSQLLTYTAEGIMESAEIDLASEEKELLDRCKHVSAEVVMHKYGGRLLRLRSSACPDVSLPVHQFILYARSPVLAQHLRSLCSSRNESVPDVLNICYDGAGQTTITLHDADFLAMFNFWLYLYCDRVYSIWTVGRHVTEYIQRCRKIRMDVMKIASALEMPGLERAVRVQTVPSKELHRDLERAIMDDRFFDDADVVIKLDGEELKAHSEVLCQRSLFFTNMFSGRSHGQLLEARRLQFQGQPFPVYLEHINPTVFQFVHHYLYTDADEDLFDDVRCDELEDLVDLILDVMSVADELMIDRLAQICQKWLGKYANNQNVCHYLNAVSPYLVGSFKRAGLEHICINLATMLENRFLDDLDADLLAELNGVCQENQSARYPNSRERNSDKFWRIYHPQLWNSIAREKRRHIDAMRVRSRLREYEFRERRLRPGETLSRPGKAKPEAPTLHFSQPPESQPEQKAKSVWSTNDLMFDMDEDTSTAAAGSSKQTTSSNSPLPTESSAPKTPWNLDKSHRPIADLSSILAEASTHKSTPKAAADARQHVQASTPTSSGKLSQKERRRLQQQQMRELALEKEQKANFRASPWQAKPQPQTASPSSPLNANKSPGQVQTPTSKPSMTLRQTIAGGSAQARAPSSTEKASPSAMPSSSKPNGTPSSQRVPVPNPNSPFARTPSSRQQAPTTPSRTGSFPSSSIFGTNGTPPTQSPARPTPPPIRSVRYNTNPAPTPAEGSSTPSKSSLAAILYEQQTEKDIIREAATAKHNLQDIQLEQQFQQWWEQASKRAIEEEAEMEAAAAAAAEAAAAEEANRSQSRDNDGKVKGKERKERNQGQRQRRQQSQGVSSHRGNESGSNPGSQAPSPAVAPQQQPRRRGRQSRRGVPFRGREEGRNSSEKDQGRDQPPPS